MALTYTTLSQAIQDYTQSDETTFVTNIPVIVKQAEDRILKNTQLAVFRKSLADNLTASSEYYTLPSDYLATYSFAVDNSGFEFLLFKKVSFMREAYPLSTTEGVPRYYGVFSSTQFIVAPTPNANFDTELNYFYRPETIVTASTSWLGTHAESTLLWSCLYEAQIFLKGDADEIALAKERYDSSLAELKLLGEGRNETDMYRHGI